MTNNKRMVVEVKFSGSRDSYKVKLRALHNGKYVTAKHSETGELDKVFDVATDFINKNEATNIALKRGVIEDKFAKHLENYYEENKGTSNEDVEGVSVAGLDEDEFVLLGELPIFKACFNLAIKREDYLGAIYQGDLYLQARQEFIDKTSLVPNSYEADATIPFNHKEKLLEAIEKFNQDGSEYSKEKLVVNKNKYNVTISKTDYKAVFNLDKSLDKSSDKTEGESNA